MHCSNQRADVLLCTWGKLLARTLLEKIKPRGLSNRDMTNKFRREKVFKYHITITSDLVFSTTQWGFLTFEAGSTKSALGMRKP